MRSRFIFSLFLAMFLAYHPASYAQFGDLLKKGLQKTLEDAVNKGQSKNDKESDEAGNDGLDSLQSNNLGIQFTDEETLFYARQWGYFIQHLRHKSKYAVFYEWVQQLHHPEAENWSGKTLNDYSGYASDAQEDFISLTGMELRDRVYSFAMQGQVKPIKYFDSPFYVKAETDKWDEDTKLLEYQKRLEKMKTIVNTAVGGELNMWTSRFSEEGWAKVGRDDQKQRLTWMCENIFNEVAVAQTKKVSDILNYSETELCELAATFGEDKSHPLTAALDVVYSFDAKQIANTSTGVLLTPNNIADLRHLLVLPVSNYRYQEKLLNGTVNAKSLKNLLNSMLRTLAIDMNYAAYHGIAPPRPFERYKSDLAEWVKIFLFENVSSLSDIDERMVQGGLTASDFSFILDTIDTSALTASEQRIMATYEKKLGSLPEMQARRDAEERATEERQEREELISTYRGIATYFALTQACYSARKGYAVPYITNDEMKKATAKWDAIKQSYPLGKVEQQRIVDELKDNPDFKFFVQAASLPEFDLDRAEGCDERLSALLLYPI